MDAVSIFWLPAGFNIPDVGSKALIDVTDGDTPNISMPIRMLSVDTPEVTAETEAGAAKVDEKFIKLADWIESGAARVSGRFADYILPKLKTGVAGTLQYTSGRAASAWLKAETERRLTKPNGEQRRLFVRVSEPPFDNYGRLLAYVAPNFSASELASMSREERATFNLDLVASGWGASFVIYPSIPGETDLPLLVEKAADAFDNKRGQWAEALQMPAYEYRMCEKLHQITTRLENGEKLSISQRLEWRSRYCADMRDRTLYGPEDYMLVPPPYRLWFWPKDVQDAVGKLNLSPHSTLVS